MLTKRIIRYSMGEPRSVWQDFSNSKQLRTVSQKLLKLQCSDINTLAADSKRVYFLMGVINSLR